MWYSVGKGPIWSVLETEILREIGEKVKILQKNYLPYFGVLGHQKYPYVDRILKKSLPGSIHTQFYVVMKGQFDRLLLQLCTVSVRAVSRNDMCIMICLSFDLDTELIVW